MRKRPTNVSVKHIDFDSIFIQESKLGVELLKDLNSIVTAENQIGSITIKRERLRKDDVEEDIGLPVVHVVHHVAV